MKNSLTSLMNCDPDSCPIAENCPVGPVPHLPCRIKEEFDNALNDRLADTFHQLDKHPEVSVRLNFMIKPLFEQLLRLRIAEISDPAIMKGRFVNPILKEIRQTILAIDKVLTETMKSYYGLNRTKNSKDPLDATSKGYYEMLLTDGAGSVETSTSLAD